MSKLLARISRILIILLWIVIPSFYGQLFAQTSYTSNLGGGSGDWDDPASWTPSGVPGSADDATILVGDTISIVANEQVDNILINGVLDHFGKSLTVNGDYEVNGLHQADENITMNGVGATLNGTGTIRLIGTKDLQINDDRTILSTADLVISLDAGSQNLVVSSAIITNLGHVELIGGMVKGTSSGTWINSTGSELTVTGTISTVNFTFTASASGNTVDYRGDSRTLTLPTASTYYNLKIGGAGTKALAGPITVNGYFENKVTFDAGGYDIDLKGNWTNTGTFTPGTGEVSFSGTSDQSINNAETFYDLNISTTSGEVDISDDINITNTLTLDGIILTGSNKVTVGNGVGTGSITYSSGAVVGNLEQYTSASASQSIDFYVGSPNFDQSGYKITTATISSTSVTAGGTILVKFVNSIPGNGGSPWTESITFYNTFTDGYWSISASTFAATSFDLSLKIDELEGFTIDNTERILSGTSPSWSFKGTHGTNDGTTVTRTGLTTFEDFAIADDFNCSAPSIPVFTTETNTTCLGNTDLYEVSLTSGYTYYWTVSGGTFQENGSTAYNAFEDVDVTVDWGSTGGNYEVTVSAYDPGCTFSDIATSSVTLEPFPTSSISGRDVLEENTQDEPYSVTSLGANYSYNWTINGGTQDLGTTTESITVDWGSSGMASVVVNSSTTDCPSISSDDETLSVDLFTTFVTAAAGDLDTDANWVGGTAPGDLDNVKIQHAMTDNGTKRYTHVQITSSGSVTTSKDFEIVGVFTNNGTLTSTNQSVILNPSNEYNMAGTGTLTAKTLDFSGSNRPIDSLATLTFDINTSMDLQGVTLTNHGTMTFLDLPPSGTGTINTTDAENVIIYGGSGAQNFADNSVIPAYYNLTIESSGAKEIQNDISVKGDLTQTGSATLDASTNSATVSLNGTASQTLSGTLDFYDLTINNSAANPAITNNGAITIANSATFTDGVIDNQGTITFNDATVSSAANSYVDGPVTFIAGTNTSFAYPLGNGDIWARMGVSSLASASQFTGQYYYSDPQVAYGTTIDATDFPNPAANISTEEYWTLSWDGGGTESAIVTLYWEDGTRSGISDLADLTITKWDGTGWGNDGGVTTSTTGSTSAGTVYTNAAYTAFSPFTFASPTGTNALPVELVFFKANIIPGGVMVEWQTASEKNNEYFELQHTLDPENFYALAHIEGAGSSDDIHNYSYVHDFPAPGINYYRLKQVDFDGSITFSQTVSVYLDPESIPFSFKVFPNPVSDGKVTLQGNLNSEIDEMTIILRNINGEVIMNEKVQPRSKLLRKEYVLELASGLYIFQLTQGFYTNSVKFLVK